MSDVQAGDGVPDPKRSHARRNEAALLRAATAAIHREGLRVALGTIADDAGVGIATLYRHFPSREHLLIELIHRSLGQILANARDARQAGTDAVGGLRLFIEAAISQRNHLVLPLQGGPPLSAPATIALQRQVHHIVRELIDRGRQDGSINVDVTPRELVAFGAMLAQPHAPDPDWDELCRHLLATYLSGLSHGVSAATSRERPSPTPNS